MSYFEDKENTDSIKEVAKAIEKLARVLANASIVEHRVSSSEEYKKARENLVKEGRAEI